MKRPITPNIVLQTIPMKYSNEINKLESELQSIETRKEYLLEIIAAFRKIEEHEKSSSTDYLVSELERYMNDLSSQGIVKSDVPSKVMSAINNGTDIQKVGGFVNRLKDQQVKDNILQYSWEIRIRRGQLQSSQIPSLKESVERMEKYGTLKGEKLSWFQEQIETF